VNDAGGDHPIESSLSKYGSDVDLGFVIADMGGNLVENSTVKMDGETKYDNIRLGDDIDRVVGLTMNGPAVSAGDFPGETICNIALDMLLPLVRASREEVYRVSHLGQEWDQNMGRTVVCCSGIQEEESGRGRCELECLRLSIESVAIDCDACLTGLPSSANYTGSYVFVLGWSHDW